MGHHVGGAARIGVLALLLSLVPVGETALRAELASEPIPNIVRLPSVYPAHWVFVHDMNFPALLAGKLVIVDPTAENRHYKGAVGAAQMASFRAARTRSEFYVAETFHARGTDGARTDVISIYDKASLRKTGEILLPAGRRGQFVTQRDSFSLSGDERFAFVFNFTPAASVGVVDLEARQVRSEIPVPGCVLAYPTGRRGFSSLCGNGTMVSYALDGKGEIVERHISARFNDIDDDPLFLKRATVGGIAYFPTYGGRIRPIDLTGSAAKVLKPWSLLDEADRAAGWRPGGWQLISADAHGRLHVLMHEGAEAGGHERPGSEVWVFNPERHARIRRIHLVSPGVSIEAVGKKQIWLVVVNEAMELDVYDAQSGRWLRRIGGGLANSPFALQAAD